MSKVVKLSSVMEREEKLKEIYEGLEEIKDQLTALIDEYEEEETHTGKVAEITKIPKTAQKYSPNVIKKRAGRRMGSSPAQIYTRSKVYTLRR